MVRESQERCPRNNCLFCLLVPLFRLFQRGALWYRFADGLIGPNWLTSLQERTP